MFVANILGPDAFLVLLLAIVVIFGANKLPKMARNIGEASKEFKKAQAEAEAESKAPDPKPAPADDRITMSKSDLEALLAERDAKARGTDTPPTAN